MIYLIGNALKPVVEIIILWMMFYRILVFFEGTRAFQVLKGITYLLAIYLFSIFFDLPTLNWLLTKVFGISIIAILIIFQQELRHGLARLGQQHHFSTPLEEAEIMAVIEQMASATDKLASKRIGCLLAIERETKLKTYIESGITVDSLLTEELLQSIFAPASPLHDGGVIVRGERIIAASCLFPLSENPHFNKTRGTRHRAALGLSEQTDAIVLMVSEENGEMALAVDGKFIPIQNREKLIDVLREMSLGHFKKKPYIKNDKIAVNS